MSAQRRSPSIAVIIPALDEEAAIGRVIADIPAELGAQVVVADNGSTDRTAAVARAHGARVVEARQRGYGAACLAGMAALAAPGPPPEVVVFLDGDYSDFPQEMSRLVAPIVRGEADLVIGSRVAGARARGALPLHSLFGNWVATRLLRLLYGQRVSDLGPFRAIRYDALMRLEMRDPRYGWTVEMQAKAAKRGLWVVEVPVSYRRRIGRSKITGCLVASARAGWTIMATLVRLRVVAR